MRGDVADGSGPVLVGTKLRPLTVRDQVFPRERLMERLRGGSGLGLSLVACPPGYGETTLLAAWHEVAERAQGAAVDSGHFLAEEAPLETLAALEPFFGER